MSPRRSLYGGRTRKRPAGGYGAERKASLAAGGEFCEQSCQ